MTLAIDPNAFHRPVVIGTDGIFGRLAAGGLLNINGTIGPIFTVGGRGLLFDDGTSTAGGSSTVVFTLQAAYDNSTTGGITLATGKDFSIFDDSNSSLFFKVDAETGKVTITGDLEVLGASSIINSTIQDSDHWLVSPASGLTTALVIKPDTGVIMTADLVNIFKSQTDVTPAFRIDSAGIVYTGGNIEIGGNVVMQPGGLVDGVNISQLSSDLASHINGLIGYRHSASDIDITPIATLPGATNVQEALNDLNSKVNSLSSSIGGVQGYEHIQTAAAASWTITHGLDTMRVTVTVYDSAYEQMVPNMIKVLNSNTVIISFSSPTNGRAMLLLF